MLFEADLPNHAEDVTATVERKLDALLAHESQFESTMHAKGGDPDVARRRSAPASSTASPSSAPPGTSPTPRSSP